jgi:hypothetical protein
LDLAIGVLSQEKGIGTHNMVEQVSFNSVDGLILQDRLSSAAEASINAEYTSLSVTSILEVFV